MTMVCAVSPTALLPGEASVLRVFASCSAGALRTELHGVEEQTDRGLELVLFASNR
ncbi:hypothetical protein [Streptomyces coeruleorubidus]|uniref:hypothetical protein n=1 Tax=Streptomyces coeruleorubidus TaxID=116188 RepID=UPI0037A893D5